MAQHKFYILFILSLFATGLYSQTIPGYSVELFHAPLPGYIFITPAKQGGGGTIPAHMILDGSGKTVYFRQMPVNIPAPGFKLHENGFMSYFRGGRYLILDSTFTVIDSIACQNGISTDSHDMEFLPNGNVLIIGEETITMDLSSYHMFRHNGTAGSSTAQVNCSVIQELDSSGSVVFEWHAKDHYPFDDVDSFYLANPNTVEWTHVNSVELAPDGNLLISIRFFNELDKIDHVTGNIIWRLRGKHNQFTIVNDSLPFYGQHDARYAPNGNITLFENGYNSTSHGCRALEYEVDETTMTATAVYKYTYDPLMYSTATGSTQHIPGIGYLVDFGNVDIEYPLLAVVDSLQQLMMKIKFDNLQSSYRACYYDHLPWALNRPEVTCLDSAGNHYLQAPAGYASYKWSDGSTSRAMLVSDTGDFTVFVPYGGEGGYLSSESIHVTDTTQLCAFLLSATNIDTKENRFSISPVPGSVKINVFMNSDPGMENIIRIYDIAGNLLMAIPFQIPGEQKAGHEIDVSTLAAGIYIAKLNGASAKFIKVDR